MISTRKKLLTGAMALLFVTPVAQAQTYQPAPGVGMQPIMDGPGERGAAMTVPPAAETTVDESAPVLTDSSEATMTAPVVVDRAMDEPPLTNINIHTIQTADAGAPTQSLGTVLRWTYDNNPSIRAARQELYATQESLPQAQAGWKPSADLNANVTRTWLDGVGEPDGSTEKGFGASIEQPLYRGGRTIAASDSARNLIMAQRSFLKATEQDVLLSVVTSYMNVLRDQALHDLAVNNRDLVARQLQASRARFDVGDVTRTDVSQSEARLAQAEAGITNSRGTLRSSLAVFEQVVGMPAGRLSYPDMKIALPATRDSATQQAESDNPSVLASEYLKDSADKDIDRVFGELLPEVGLFASWARAYDPSPGLRDETTSTALGIQASMPLYEAGSTRSRVRQAKHTASQRLMEINEARRLARQQAVSNWEDLEAARAAITSREAQVVATRVAREGVKKEAELGTRTILDALDADQEYLDAQVALVTAQRNEVVARYSLASTLGLLTPETLGFPELSNDYDTHLDDITRRIFSMDTENTVDDGQNGL